MPILIAEDNVAQRAYLRELLEREFAEYKPILEAADGESVVRMALAERPQLCVLDIQMPGLSGVKAARAIWKGFPAGADNLLDSVPARNLHQRDSQDRARRRSRRPPTASSIKIIPKAGSSASSPPCWKTART